MIRFAILFSGRGSNLDAIIAHWKHSEEISDTHASQPVLALSNRPGVGGVERARAHGLPCEVIDHKAYSSREAHERAMVEALDAADVTWIVCAGYMRVLTPAFISRFEGRVLNTHPALLPAFPGLDGPGQALAAGVKFSGCTIHLVDDGVDSGPIVAQGVVPVHADDTPEALGARIRTVEHELYPRVIAQMLAGRYRRDEGRVYLDGSAPETR